MSDTVVVAVIGAAGTVIGSIATILVARLQAAQKSASNGAANQGPPAVVLGLTIELRELRILRALFAEPNGRVLASYTDRYYRPALEAVQRKGWVKRIADRYYMTAKGAEICREYLKHEILNWKPTDQLLS